MEVLICHHCAIRILPALMADALVGKIERQPGGFNWDVIKEAKTMQEEKYWRVLSMGLARIVERTTKERPNG